MSQTKKDNLKKIFNKEYSYPLPDDAKFQKKIYEKLEFYLNRVKERPSLKDYEEIKRFRQEYCQGKKFALRSHQTLLKNYINPNTPYSGLLVFHGTGTGKTCAAISIAEQFKNQVNEYETKIYIITAGRLSKEQWREDLLKCTGDPAYYEPNEKKKQQAISIAGFSYKLITRHTFSKRVLGHGIKEKDETGKKRTIERNYGTDRLISINNSIIIVDEAHNLINNTEGRSLLEIKKNSHNLKIVLLSATPMRNVASEIVEMINLARPLDSPIMKSRIFTNDRPDRIAFIPGGQDYLRKMCVGYVSYLRGTDPVVFATRVDHGTITSKMKYTKLSICNLHGFQKTTFNNALQKEKIQEQVEEAYEDETEKKVDALNFTAIFISNFAVPVLSGNELVGAYGNDGINKLKEQLKTKSAIINRKVATEILGKEYDGNEEYVYLTQDKSTITGKILQEANLRHFSTKFRKAFRKIRKLHWGYERGPRTAFIYSNLIKTGIRMFQEVLIQNGYLEFNEGENYAASLEDNTVCYFCGHPYKDHGEHQSLVTKDKPVPPHTFGPATFIVIRGKNQEDAEEDLQEEKKKILEKFFSIEPNKEGKHIKLVLGSKVMAEGINLRNVSDVHILDAWHNLGKVDQAVGRAIRECSHYNIMSDKNPFPKVNVYKYVAMNENGYSPEEEMYRKAENKDIMIKKVERILKETAIDCPLNRPVNVFENEIEKYKDCIPIDEINETNKDKVCPAICDYTKCNFKCYDQNLNEKYFDEKENKYLPVEKYDRTTFNIELIRTQIDEIKELIIDLYRFKFIYSLDSITSDIRKQTDPKLLNIFGDTLTFKALDELCPVTKNEFIQYKTFVYDKFNRKGYLKNILDHYVFYTWEDENVAIEDIINYVPYMENPVTLNDYLREITLTDPLAKREVIKDDLYHFAKEYYDGREENEVIGYIDPKLDGGYDFKVRTRREKSLVKKRAVGLPSITGAVCYIKDKIELKDIADKIKLSINDIKHRKEICKRIEERLLELEKYTPGKSKKTYVIVPHDHPKFPFPYNLDDRIERIKEIVNEKTQIKNKFNVKQNKYTSGPLKNKPYYEVTFDKDKHTREIESYIKEQFPDLKEQKGKYTILVN